MSGAVAAAVAEHIVSLRQRVCPRTSYVTSGLSASIAYCLVSPPSAATSSDLALVESQYQVIAEALTSSEEFDRVQRVCNVEEAVKLVNGNIVIIFGCERLMLDNAIQLLLATRKTKLLVQIRTLDVKEKNSVPDRSVVRKQYSSIVTKFEGLEVLSCFNYQTVRAEGAALKGFNGQPSVQSASQFKYLWSPSTPQIEQGKDRVLQRLADKSLFGTQSKLSLQQWDSLVRGAINCGMDDYGVYSLIREKVLGSSLAADLEKQILHGSSSSHADSDKQRIDDSINGEGDGRANHMVSRTLESVPAALRQSSSSLRRVLDYGCAEGAITAALGKQLGLPASQVLGADVRAIPSVGFTFVQLPAESEEPPALGTILPQIADHSVDLITAAMVFHHVTHVKAALLELRRIISSQGALVIREHHCGSADMGAFLDITHGLYSLSWSSPVEWPDFIAEYKAFYRSREEWDLLIQEAGFTLYVQESGQQAIKNYQAAEYATQKPNGFFPNVIKAYYAVYVPNPTFKLPAKPSVSQILPQTMPGQSVSQLQEQSGVGHKRGIEDFNARSEELKLNKIQKVSTSSTTSSAANHPGASARQEIFESSKYPGKFYRINKSTGAAEWVN